MVDSTVHLFCRKFKLIKGVSLTGENKEKLCRRGVYMSRKRDRIAKKDPRNSSYITYSTKEMLGPLYYKGIAGISSMRAMTEAFNNEQVTRNLYQFMDGKEKEYLKTFDDAKILEKWHILVDGEEKQLNSEKG